MQHFTHRSTGGRSKSGDLSGRLVAASWFLTVTIPASLLIACSGSSGGSDPGEGAAPPAVACVKGVDAARFASSDRLWQHHVFLDSLKLRSTASPSHKKFVDWLDARLDEIPGLERREHWVTIDRWLEREVSLMAGPVAGALQNVPVASAVPYSKVSSGAPGALIYVPLNQAIDSADVAGKIVLRDAGTGTVPSAAFTALEWWLYDPDFTLTATIGDIYEREWISAVDRRIQDMQAAGEAGAAGMVFIQGFPLEQVRGHYTPYTGDRWPLPAVYVGVDEGEVLKQLADTSGRARIVVTATEGLVPTRSLFATLPGQSAERIVIQSHTDGTNVHEDNGPLVILEMARYFAQFPVECRPKTLEFAFTTGHFYLREAGAGVYSQQLDFDYEDGTVAMALVLEHMGTRNYDAVPRGDGLPGREMVLTGLFEPMSMFINSSPLLAETALQTVVEHDLRGSLALRGADAPGPHIPLHFSFGGEGTGYARHLIPTVAYITAPWPLFNPAFGLEVLDKDLLYRQTLMFTDFVHKIAEFPREAIAGGLLAEREARAALCASPVPPGSTVQCEGTPADPGEG